MATEQERKVLREFLELYVGLPCLWDIGSKLYKNKNRKAQAWCLLAKKLKEIEPNAEAVSAKKKIDYMRDTYRRESKRVRESKRNSAADNKVHVPKLWYYNILEKMDIKDEQARNELDMLASDDVTNMDIILEHPELTDDGDRIHCKTCDVSIQRKKFNIGRHIQSKSHQEKISGFSSHLEFLIKDHPCLQIRDDKIYCTSCESSFQAEKCRIDRHLESVMHANAKVNDLQKEFNKDLVECLVSCNIPWEQLNNPKFRKFIENCLNNEYGHEIVLPTESNGLISLDFE